jgi:hypothetical protein
MFMHMAGVDDDIQMVRDLIAWTGTNANRVAAAIGKPNTTINRFSNGKAVHRMARDTVNALRGAFPEFPGFVDRPEPNGAVIAMEGPSLERMRPNFPVYGTALGADRRVDGEAVEQTTLNRAEVMMYVKRPTLLNERADTYGLVVAGSSMEPRHMDGEMIVVDPKGRVRPTEDVVVYLRPTEPEQDDGETARAVLVKRLVRRTASYIELEQYTPAIRFQVRTDEIVRIDRVIPWSELLS